MVWGGSNEKRNKRGLCFHVKISPLSSLCGAVSQTLMRSLFQDQSHLSLWENIHACPHPPGSSAISLAETMKYIEDIRWTVQSPLFMANLLFCTFGSSECFVMFTLYTQQQNSMTWNYFLCFQQVVSKWHRLVIKLVSTFYGTSFILLILEFIWIQVHNYNISNNNDTKITFTYWGNVSVSY